MNCILLRYSEIGLKSSNVRNKWLILLRNNIIFQLDLHNIDYSKVNIIPGRIIVYTTDISAPKILRRIFGIVSFSPAFEVDLTIEAIMSKVEDIFLKETTDSFRITTQRINKKFSYTSQDINCIVGENICNLGGKVDLKYPTLNIHVEINNNAYVFKKIYSGVKGLPLGSQSSYNKCIAIISTYKDLLCCLMAMKRGCNIDIYIFSSIYSDIYKNILLNYINSNTNISIIDDIKVIEQILEINKDVVLFSHTIYDLPIKICFFPLELYGIELINSTNDSMNISCE